MRIQHLKNLDESEFDRPLWRYLTFPKYISMLAYGALWFPKLNILQDKFEGRMPARVDTEMRAEHERLKQNFHPSLHDQFDRMNQRNVDDGRELTAVSCWFLSSNESSKMWSAYTANCEGVAIKSTVRS